MEKLAFEYPFWEPSGAMNLGVLALWILVLTLVGFAARKIVRGKPLIGLMGDAIFALVGVFLIGSLLKAFEISLTGWLAGMDLGPLNEVTRWVDIALVGFIGALVLRAVLRPITGKA